MDDLNLNKIFWGLENEIYCIVKGDINIKEYQKGEAIDIFCFDVVKVCNNILAACSIYIERDIFTIDITRTNNEECVHLLILNKEGLEFAFHIYGQLPLYKKLNIKQGLFSSMIENSIQMKAFYNEHEYFIFIANSLDKLVLSYIEFIEYYNQSSSRKEHWRYILEKISDDDVRIKFFDKIHYYTEFPNSNILEDHKWKKWKDYIYKVRNTPLNELIWKIKRKLQK